MVASHSVFRHNPNWLIWLLMLSFRSIIMALYQLLGKRLLHNTRSNKWPQETHTYIAYDAVNICYITLDRISGLQETHTHVAYDAFVLVWLTHLYPKYLPVYPLRRKCYFPIYLRSTEYYVIINPKKNRKDNKKCNIRYYHHGVYFKDNR